MNRFKINTCFRKVFPPLYFKSDMSPPVVPFNLKKMWAVAHLTLKIVPHNLPEVDKFMRVWKIAGQFKLSLSYIYKVTIDQVLYHFGTTNVHINPICVTRLNNPIVVPCIRCCWVNDWLFFHKECTCHLHEYYQSINQFKTWSICPSSYADKMGIQHGHIV